MKIGIVTQPLMANYGGTLQNFALQQILKRLGHTSITVDFIPKISYFRYLLSVCKTMVLFFMPGKRRAFFKRYIPQRNALLDQFVRKHINTTSQIPSYKSNLISEYGFEALITGSDQVWRPMYNFYLEDMFLRFAKDAKIKKIAYAASFGVDYWEFSKKQTKSCKKWAQYLDAVTVREASGIQLCKQYLNVDAVEMLDPTLLLNQEDYEQVCGVVPKIKTPFLASYVLDFTPKKETFIRKIALEKGLPVKIFSAHKDMALSVEEWLSMFRDAEYIITDSFHGTVFSIIFNKPFISIGNEDRGLSRFKNLLGKFDLLNCLLSEDKLEQYTLSEIDWEKTNQLRNEWKERSFEFFIKQLK